MPNWCNNSMTISHSDPVMLKKALDAWNSGKFLQTLVPCPQDLINTICGSFGDDEKQKALNEKQALNIEKHGYPTWWDYCVAEWGTKWDVGHQSEHDDIAEINGGQFFVSFDSAWSPPTNAYEKLKNMGYVIEAYYAETGCDFCGKWDDGIDYCYRISSGDIPDDIVECMGLEFQE